MTEQLVRNMYVKQWIRYAHEGTATCILFTFVLVDSSSENKHFPQFLLYYSCVYTHTCILYRYYKVKLRSSRNI